MKSGPNETDSALRRWTCVLPRMATRTAKTLGASWLVFTLALGTAVLSIHSPEALAHPLVQETPEAETADQEATAVAARIAALETQVAAQATEIAGMATGSAPIAAATEDPLDVAVTPEDPLDGVITTPAPVSAGAPLLVSNGIELLYYYFGERSSSDRTPIYGELRNTTNTLMSAPTLNVTFYDADDQIVDTAEVSAVNSILRPGETMPMDGATDLAPGTWAREEIDLQGGGVANDIALIFYAEGLEIQNVNEVEKTLDSLRVLGEIHNTGSKEANLLVVRALIYEADGKYAGYYYGQINADSVPAGGDVSFEIDGRIDAGRGWTYRILVSGWPVS
jgi:hypothetical protein